MPAAAGSREPPASQGPAPGCSRRRPPGGAGDEPAQLGLGAQWSRDARYQSAGGWRQAVGPLASPAITVRGPALFRPRSTAGLPRWEEGRRKEREPWQLAGDVGT